MVIKGQSRAGPKQLALHLQRSDTNERVQILQLQSALGNLTQALRDWQLLVRGTRGTKGMYHANIDPDARYAMTPELWQRAADVLEQELGLIGQPRVIVLHEKKGREHIHIVWQRTNVDTMTLVPDSNNYYAHERASLTLETEFGHEHVPGKHAKRDRTKPPPKAEINDAEWQQAERTGGDPRARKTTITALYEHSDSGQALRAALSGAGYILARGDRRDYVIVDGQGEVHSLARQIAGATVNDLRALMADIDRDSIPSIEQATALQRDIAASPSAAPTTQAEVSPPQPTPEPDWHPQGVAPEQLASLKRVLKERHNEAERRLCERQERERTRTEEAIDREIAEKLDALDALHQAARSRFDREHNEERGGLHRIVAMVMAWISPAKAAREQAREAQAREEFLRCQQFARAGQIERLNSTKEHSLTDLSDRHEQQRREQSARYEQELARFTRDQDAARRLLAEDKRMHRQQEPDADQLPAPAAPQASLQRGLSSSRFLQPQSPARQPRFIPTTPTGVAISPPTAVPPVAASRFLQPGPRNPPTDGATKPPARHSRFIATTAEGVAVPAQTPPPTPVTASRFLTKSPEPPKTEPPQTCGLNSKFLRPCEGTPQPAPAPKSKPSPPKEPSPSR